MKIRIIISSILAGTCFVMGLAIGSSELWMPWAQIMGAVIFSGTLPCAYYLEGIT